MINGRSVMAIIPARGGSKRLPRKNILPFCGKPLIQWTIEAAMGCEYIDRIAVSTEDDLIKDACSGYPVWVVDRPLELAGDKSSIYDVIFNVIDKYEHFHYTVLLQPTSPLRTSDDISRCLELCEMKNAPSCISIERGKPDANGAVYVAWTTWLREMKLFDAGRVVTYEQPPWRSVDINTVQDFNKAEGYMKCLTKQSQESGEQRTGSSSPPSSN